MTFTGAKMALFLGDELAVIERDDKPDIPFPGYLDLPGGGREQDETPLECALRECHEELGLLVPENAVSWERAFEQDGSTSWFFVAHLPAATVQDIRFGDEGQGWMMMSVGRFLTHPMAVPHLQQRLRVWLKENPR